MTNTVKIKIREVARTDLAILVDDGVREVWVPHSQVVEEEVAVDERFGLAATVAIMVEDWVAREKGLQVSHEDEQTGDLFGGAS